MRTLMLTAVCVFSAMSLAAEPSPRSMAAELGYTQELLSELSAVQGKRAINPDFPQTKERPAKAPPVSTELLRTRTPHAGEPAQMIPYLMNLQKKQPGSPKITRKLALTCLQAGQPREALYWFSQTWFRDRKDFPALWNMAALSFRLGERRSAHDYLKEYAQVDPNSAWGRMARDFLAGPTFGGPDLADGFVDAPAQGGSFGGGPAGGAGSSGGSSLMVIGGKETLPEDFLQPNRELPGNPLNPMTKFAGKKATSDTHSAKATGGSAPVAAKAPITRAEIEFIRPQVAPPEPPLASAATPPDVPKAPPPAAPNTPPASAPAAP